MGYYDHDEEAPAPGGDGLATTQQVLGICVRLLGAVLLIVGIWTAVVVLLEAWNLYRDPHSIERFAVAVEQGSHLDRALAGRPAAGRGGGIETGARSDEVRVSYFVAWFVALALLLVLGTLAGSVIAAGGRLALHDTQIRRLSRAVVKEVSRLKRVA